jgi:outer membrane protein assembly complex protein YaeT
MKTRKRSSFWRSRNVLTVLPLTVPLLLWCAAGFAQTPPGPGTMTVADVIVTGNKLVSTSRIMSMIHTRAGTEFVRETANEDARRLMETKLFGNVSVELKYLPDNKVKVYFNIREPRGEIEDIIYEGVKHGKKDELNTLIGLRKGQPLNPIANEMACRTIERHYHEDGRPFATCELVEGGHDGDTRVVFRVTEGPVVKVRDIAFTGNTFVSAARLATQITSSKEWFHMFGGRYNDLMADMDVGKLVEYYKSWGYQQVHVSKELVWDEDMTHVTLVFHIQEGLRYKVAGVSYEGVKTFPRDQIEQLGRVKQGEFYNEAKAEGDVKAIKDYYGWTGRPTLVKKDLYYPEPGVVQVVYQVQERPPTRVGQIFIVGNEVTRQNVILRQIPLYPGQVLTYPDLAVAEKNLARLNIFEMNQEKNVKPTVTVLNPDSDEEFKDILVQVEETRTGSLLFGVGVNSDAGLTGSIVLNERNFDITKPPTSLDDLLSGHAFRGAGEELRLEAMPGTQVQRYSGTFREPFLFDSPYSLTVGGYYFTRIYDEYDESRLGSRITLGRRLNQYWSASLTYRIEDVGVHNVVSFAPQDFQDVVGDNFLTSLRAGVTRDTRDSYLRPTSGSLLDIAYEQYFTSSSQGVTAIFPQVNVEFNKYFTLYERPDQSGRQVLAFHSQLGWSGDNTPVYERFYAGGFRSIRGFAFRGVSPDIDGFKVGGDFQFLNSLEYQIPLKANDQIFLVGFIDSGTVEPRITELKDYRVSAGFGLRFVVPMLGPVPIALDFGFPIVKAASDKEQVFSFWLGFFH